MEHDINGIIKENLEKDEGEASFEAIWASYCGKAGSVCRPVMRMKRRVKYVLAAVALAAACTVGISLMPPDMALAVSKLPVIGSVFKLIGDPGLMHAGEKGLTAIEPVTASDKGIDFTVTDVMYDGARLSVGYTISCGRGERRIGGDYRIYVDSRGITTGMSQTSSQVGTDVYAGVLEFTGIPGDLPEKFKLKLEFGSMLAQNPKLDPADNSFDLDEIKGSWTFDNIAVSRLKGVEVVHPDPKPVKSYGDTTLWVDSVTFSQSTTAIYLKGKVPTSGVCHNFQITDDTGTVLPILSTDFSGSSYGEGDLLHQLASWEFKLQPFKKKPEFFVIKPADTYSIKSVPLPDIAGEGRAPYNIGAGIDITGMDFLEDKAVLHISFSPTDRRDPSFWPLFWLKDGSGNIYRGMTEPDNETRTGNITFKRDYVFPAVGDIRDFEILTNSRVDDADMPEAFEIKVPVR